MPRETVLIGVLALQGGFASHAKSLAAEGFDTLEMRTAKDIASVAGIVIPGGESTVMTLLLERHGLFGPLKERIDSGTPCLGTCAGMIMMSSGVDQMGQKTLAAMDFRVNRNAYGSQAESFEAPLQIPVLGSADFPGIFIRAPRVASVGRNCDVLASFEGTPVLLRQGNRIAASFHPELADDRRLHALFGNMCVENFQGR